MLCVVGCCIFVVAMETVFVDVSVVVFNCFVVKVCVEAVLPESVFCDVMLQLSLHSIESQHLGQPWCMCDNGQC